MPQLELWNFVSSFLYKCISAYIVCIQRELYVVIIWPRENVGLNYAIAISIVQKCIYTDACMDSLRYKSIFCS